MANFINFISTNYHLIIEGVLLVISVVVFILRKRPIHDIMSYIYKACVKATQDVEDSFIVGSDEKLASAVKIVVDTLKLFFPDIDIKVYSSLIVSTIEELLDTPHRHGEKGVTKNEKKKDD